MEHVIEAAGSGSGSGGNYTLLIILVIAMAGLFLMSRRTQKKQKAAQEFRQNLTPGQDVMTASGMLGQVVAVDGDEITIESTPGHRTRWVRAAIAKVIEPTAADAGVAAASSSTTTHNGLLEGSADSIEIPDDLSGLPDDGDPQQGPSTTK